MNTIDKVASIVRRYGLEANDIPIDYKLKDWDDIEENEKDYWRDAASDIMVIINEAKC